jgi:hypothetical protein
MKWSNQNHQQLKKWGKRAAAGLFIAAATIGCGQGRGGQYQGTESVQGTFQMGNSVRSQLVLSIQESSSEAITGSWNTRSATGTFTGILKSNQIQNVILTRGPSNSTNNLSQQNQAYYYFGNNDAFTVCPGEYIGNLKIDGQRITGSVTPNTNGYNFQNPCSQIDIDVTKLN